MMGKLKPCEIVGTIVAILFLAFVILVLLGDYHTRVLPSIKNTPVVIERLDGVPKPTPFPKGTEVYQLAVNTRGEWTNTGIELKPDDQIWIWATGKITYEDKEIGPNGFDYTQGRSTLSPYLPFCALIGKIEWRSNEWELVPSYLFFVGAHAERRIEGEGTLFLAVNVANRSKNDEYFEEYLNVIVAVIRQRS